MKGGSKIIWSEQAESDLETILDYLEKNWTHKEIRNFFSKLERRLQLIARHPKIFPATKRRRSVRRSVLTKQITIYYKEGDGVIYLLTLFDVRQNPLKLKSK